MPNEYGDRDAAFALGSQWVQPSWRSAHLLGPLGTTDPTERPAEPMRSTPVDIAEYMRVGEPADLAWSRQFSV
jgi:hypothetical protein